MKVPIKVIQMIRVTPQVIVTVVGSQFCKSFH